MKIGSISFINSLPIDLGMLTKKIQFSGEIYRAAPFDLNEKLINGTLQVSPISALAYAQNMHDLILFPDLSISSDTSVGSVYLFSHEPIANLKNKKILVTPLGKTTPALLQILCQKKYGFQPKLEVATTNQTLSQDYPAMLLIGDEALIWKTCLSTTTLNIYDLAEEWREWTGLPFVFAVWATRRSVYVEQQHQVEEAHQALQESRDWGIAHLDEVIGYASKKIGLPQEIVKNYFSKLSFDFGANLRLGLKKYLELAGQCDLVRNYNPHAEMILMRKNFIEEKV